MKPLLKNLLSLSSVLLSCFSTTQLNAQVNYVLNGSFEKTYTCTSIDFTLKNIVGWNSADSLHSAFGGGLTSTCQVLNCCKVPLNNFSYQNPRTGFAYLHAQLSIQNYPNDRGYLKNRLKKNLKAGKTYCAKLYANSVHSCKFSIDCLGLYFGGAEVDTFSKPTEAMPNIIPQVQLNYILFDTLNWVPITGTFVATGKEKYVVIGCFKENSTINSLLTNTVPSTGWAAYNIDDVSCVELDENFAGTDTTIVPGDSIFIGKYKEEDWGDERFNWYKLPGNSRIDTVTGFWVKPVVTSTFVVKQEICSYTIWDTIVIKIKEDETQLATHLAAFLKLFPSPAIKNIVLQTNAPELYADFSSYVILNNLGQQIASGELQLTSGIARLDVSALQEGAYTLVITSNKRQKIIKRLLIGK